ncbi:hypothetical protein [Yokenella regensburgei]|uniref:hypothetical protein n=1 Tax=Yokenella regensburgei TaxID=158877 RepID=UPI0031D7E903
METVLDVLKKLGKASFKQVAAQLRIEPVEALNMLREQRELERCDFREGLWVLTGTTGAPAITQELPAKQDKPAAPVSSKRSEEPAAVDPTAITQLLHQNGSMNTVALASAFDYDGRGMVSVMRSLVRQGLVTKNGEGKGVTWSLAGKQQLAPQPEEPALPETPGPEVVLAKTSIDLLADIPVFTARKTDLIIPTADYISREIRRTESKLASLKKLRTAANNIRRHKALLQELAQ